MAVYLADKSALTRRDTRPEASDVVEPLLLAGQIATCGIVDLELLCSAPDPATYAELAEALRATPRVPMTEAVVDRAIQVQAALAARPEHRSVPLPDLLIAACADSAGLTVLHYDADYERIASVTGQAVQWVVPRGSWRKASTHRLQDRRCTTAPQARTPLVGSTPSAGRRSQAARLDDLLVAGEVVVWGPGVRGRRRLVVAGPDRGWWLCQSVWQTSVTMRTTLELDDALLAALMARLPGVSKTEAIQRAVRFYLAHDTVEQLRKLAGTVEIDDVSQPFRRADRTS